MKKLAVPILVAAVLISCTSPSGTDAVVSGSLVAGPTCPVETDPPDPSCAPRVVEGAVVTARADDQGEVEAISEADGSFALRLGPGLWTIEFAPVEGLMGTPDPIQVLVDTAEPIDLGVVAYDTGIR